MNYWFGFIMGTIASYLGRVLYGLTFEKYIYTMRKDFYKHHEEAIDD